MNTDPTSSTQQFRVEVSEPSGGYGERDETIACESVDALAACIDDQTGIGKWTALEAATEVAMGEVFEHEIETGRTVTAERVGVLVGGRS